MVCHAVRLCKTYTNDRGIRRGWHIVMIVLYRNIQFLYSSFGEVLLVDNNEQ